MHDSLSNKNCLIKAENDFIFIDICEHIMSLQSPHIENFEFIAGTRTYVHIPHSL